MTGLDKVGDAHPQIQGIAMTHDPPPVPQSESQLHLAQKPGVEIPVRCCKVSLVKLGSRSMALAASPLTKIIWIVPWT
jgi:hypothetical protein